MRRRNMQVTGRGRGLRGWHMYAEISATDPLCTQALPPNGLTDGTRRRGGWRVVSRGGGGGRTEGGKVESSGK